MLKIHLDIENPNRGDAAQLLALAVLFTSLAQGNTADQVRAGLADKSTGGRVAAGYGTTTGQVIGAGALDPADNPAAGIPSPAEAFRVESAVTAGAPIPASAPAGVDLDAEGLPWDATIHATSADGGHPKTADGKWKKKRGVGETYVNERKAQLRAALAAGNGAAPAGVPATPPANALVPPPAGAGAPVPPPPPSNPGNVPPVIPTPQASPVTTPAAAASSVTMAQLLPRVTAAITAGTLTPDSAAGLAKEISGGAIDNVAMFAVRPDLIPALWARLDVLGIAQ